jgi:hypothetical protein
MVSERDFKAIEAKLRRRKGPPKVARLEYEDRPDSTGYPSVYVYVLFTDDTPDSDQTLEKVRPISNFVKEALRAKGETRWPYVRFRRESEYAELVGQ